MINGFFCDRERLDIIRGLVSVAVGKHIDQVDALRGPRQDGASFGNQALEVFRCLSDGKPWTLPQLGERCRGLSSAHSARIRNIRDWLEETGRGTIERKPTETRGLFTYRIVREWPIKGEHYR